MIDFYVEMLASFYCDTSWFKKWARNQINNDTFEREWVECKMEERIKKAFREEGWYKRIEYLSKFFFQRLTGIKLYVEYDGVYPQDDDLLR